LNERDRLKRVLEDLAFTERCYCENDVDLEPVTEELEGTEDADDLGVLDERHQGDSPEQAPTEERHKSDAAGADEHSLRMQPPRTDLRISQFEIGKPLGRGMFGQVYLARHRTSNFICALKVISKAACASDGAEKLVLRELEVHQNMRHANILRFYAWFHNKISIYLILEYAPNGDLYSKLKTQPHGRFKEPDAARYITQMAEALRYMHRKNVIYRDIKPENILLGFRNEIKLADFGWSVHSESGFRSTVCGTLDYLSPEVAVMMLKPGQTDQWYTNAIDKWSLGVLTFGMLVGKPPFETKSIKTTEKKIANFDGCIKFPKYVSREAEDFVLQVSEAELFDVRGAADE
jgi:serine/threonine protein kinase